MRDDQAETVARILTELSGQVREVERRLIRIEQGLDRNAMMIAQIAQRLPVIAVPIEGRVS